MLRRYYGKISFLPIDEFKGHDGELVVDDITGKVYVMDGVTYGGTELVGATPRFGTTPPDSPTDGALWYDPVSGRTYIYYQQQWVDAAPNTTYSLPIAGEDVLGGIRVGNNLYIDEEGRLSAEDGNYLLPTASDIVLGGVKVDNVSIVIDGSGVIRANTTVIETNIATLFSNAAIQAANIISLNSNSAIQASNIATLFSNAATQSLLINTINANISAANTVIENKTYSSLTNNGHTLSLNTSGNLILPDSGYINYSNGQSILEGITAGISNYVLPLADANTLGGIKLGEGFTTDVSNKVTTNKLYSTNLTHPTQHYRLELDTNGVVHLPDQSIINGATLKSVAGNYAGITAGPVGKDEDSWVWVDADGAWIATKYNTDQKVWQFNNDGEIVFPDSSIQTTAYTGPVQTFVGVGAPESPTEGTMWYDTTDGRTYIYLSDVWVDASPSAKGDKGDKGDQGDQGLQGNIGPAGGTGPASVYTGGNLIPTANVTYSIGNIDFQYKDLWVSNSTIYMGGVPLSIDNTGSLTVNGQLIGGSYNDANVAAYIEANPPTGTYSNVNVAGYLIENPQNGTYNDSNVAAYLTAHPEQGLYSNSNVAAYLPTYTGFVGKLSSTDTTNSVSTSTGSFVTAGGLGVSQDVHIGGTVNITNDTPSTSYDTGALVINGGLGVNGNINLSGNINILEGNINIVEFTGATGNFYGDTVTGFGAMYAGKSGFTALPFTVAQISTNSNSYSQVNIENINSGKLASADYIGTGDIGDDSNWFFDIGIAGSGYDPVLAAENNAPGTSVGPLDAYYYVQGNASVPETGGNLTIGTSQDSKVVKFIAGGTNAENVVLTLGQDNVTAARDLIAPNVYADGYFYCNGTPIIAADGSFSITTINSTTVNAQTINTQVVNGNGATMTGMIYNPDIVNIRSNVSTLQSNVSYLQNEIDAANAAIVTANVGMKSYVDSKASTYSNSNVAAYLTGTVNVGNLITTNGVFWSNGAAYSSGSSGSSYGNSDVASYLPTYTGNIAAGNIAVTGNVNVGNITSNYRISLTNNAYIQSDTTIRSGSILLQPAATGTFPSVIIGGAGRIASPNGSVHLILNPSDFTVQVPIKATNAVGSTSQSTGAIQSSGGIGVALDSYFGANVNIVGNLIVSGTKAISMPNRPAFRVYGNGGQVASPVTLSSTYWTQDFQQGTGLDGTTGIFTAPVAGLYQVNLVVRAYTNAGVSAQVICRKTTAVGSVVSTVVMVEWAANTTMNHTGGSSIVKLAAGDTLKVDVTLGSISFDGNDNWSVAYIG